MEELHAAIAAHLRRQAAATPQRRRTDPRGTRVREVAIYARVDAASPNPSAEADLDAQIAACGETIALAYREVADGDTIERPRLTELRAFIAHGWITAVLVRSPDRLTGDPVLLGSLRSEWAPLGVAIIAVLG